MSTHLRHLEGDQLLHYVDGELPARAAAKIRGHLEACWQCRAQLEGLQTTINECVRYRRVLQRCLPSPPAPWFDIYHGFAAMDAASEPGFFERLIGLVQSPLRSRKAWAFAAAVLLVVGALVYRFRESPSVQAAELLQRAVSAAETHPGKPRTLLIRTRQHRLTRLADSRTPAVFKAADSETASSLQALFLAARFDWNDPLSARSFQAWRDQLPSKRDEVVPAPNSYQVRTSTGTGLLASASLKLRIPDLQPVEERLEFRNQEWIEITELPFEAPRIPEPAAIEHHTMPVSPASPPLSPVSPAPEPLAGIGDELRVVAALHQVRADLGDPVEISLAGANVLVTGVGIAPERQQEIRDALSGNARVIVRFAEPVPAKVQPPAATTRGSTPVSGDVRQLQTQIAQQIGGRAHFDQLASHVLDLSDTLMSRIYALRRLAEQFPPAAEAALSSDDLQVLAGLRQDHLSVIRQQSAEIDRLLRPVLTSVAGASPDGPAIGSPASWQSAAGELFAISRRVEKMLAMMFGATPGESADQELPSRLLSGLGQLQAASDAFQRIPVGRMAR